MNTWRLIISKSADAFTNMAVDEALLQTFIHKERVPVLRFYQWKPSAISIGVAQKPDKALNLSALRRDKIDFVRRMTGGEGIYHDNEITYSIVCSKHDLNLPDSVHKGFRIITNFIMDAYRKLNLQPHYAGDHQEYLHGEESSMCFATTERFDIIINGKKIGGNAQKRTGDFIFHHGSIPLKLNFNKIQRYFIGDLSDLETRTVSLEQACSKKLRIDECIKQLKDSFKKAFSVKLIRSFVSEHEKDLVHALLAEKYATKQWNYLRRTRIMKSKDNSE